jgi:hypothetical protein
MIFHIFEIFDSFDSRDSGKAKQAGAGDKSNFEKVQMEEGTFHSHTARVNTCHG